MLRKHCVLLKLNLLAQKCTPIQVPRVGFEETVLTCQLFRDRFSFAQNSLLAFPALEVTWVSQQKDTCIDDNLWHILANSVLVPMGTVPSGQQNAKMHPNKCILRKAFHSSAYLI